MSISLIPLFLFPFFLQVATPHVISRNTFDSKREIIKKTTSYPLDNSSICPGDRSIKKILILGNDFCKCIVNTTLYPGFFPFQLPDIVGLNWKCYIPEALCKASLEEIEYSGARKCLEMISLFSPFPNKSI